MKTAIKIIRITTVLIQYTIMIKAFLLAYNDEWDKAIFVLLLAITIQIPITHSGADKDFIIRFGYNRKKKSNDQQ